MVRNAHDTKKYEGFDSMKAKRDKAYDETQVISRSLANNNLTDQLNPYHYIEHLRSDVVELAGDSRSYWESIGIDNKRSSKPESADLREAAS